MVIMHNFNQTLTQYAVLGTNGDFPEIEKCPHCKACNRLKRHGFYERNAIEGEIVCRIPICRLICPCCHHTFSILPTFLLPYYQHTLSFILQILSTRLTQGICLRVRQVVGFYVKRFMRQLNQVEMFFRSVGENGGIPSDQTKKAIRLLEMISAFGEAPFNEGSTSHFQHNFMARSFYH